MEEQTWQFLREANTARDSIAACVESRMKAKACQLPELKKRDRLI